MEVSERGEQRDEGALPMVRRPSLQQLPQCVRGLPKGRKDTLALID